MTPLLTFLHPERLWLLALIPLLALTYWLLSRRSAARSRRNGIEQLDRLLPRQQTWKRHLGVAFALLSLASLNVAYAQPRDQVEVPRERATVVITIDVSNSMQATDVEPNRLVAAKQAASEFVDMLPRGFNASLVSFYGTANVVVPPTTDRALVKRAIESLQLGPSTAIGDGIYASLDALALAPADPAKPNEPTPGAIVLLSDGSTNIGRPSAAAAAAARKLAVPVHTIAYGTPGGFVVSGGQRQNVPVDKAELANVARISGGEAFAAGSNQELRQVYGTIARSVGFELADVEVTERYAGYALALAVLASVAVMSLAARWP